MTLGSTIPAQVPVKLLSPDNNARFSHYPRKLVLKWASVPGASMYIVYIESGSSDFLKWELKEKQEVKETEYVFYAKDALPGRWRVLAVDDKSNQVSQSEWRTFQFPK